MIRHIVGWNLTPTGEQERIVAATAVKDALEALVGVVPGLRDLNVYPNSADIDGNYDLCLIAHYETVDDLKAYIEHPAHREAVLVVKANTNGRFAIDIEL
jgi:heme-degrading monooxygenase HmoA